MLGEFAVGRASPETAIEETRLALAFGKHSYGHTVIGYEADVRAMPEGYEYSRRFYDRYYRPDDCVVLVAGDFHPEVVEGLFRAAYGDWKRGGPPPQVPQEPAPAGPQRKALTWDGPTRPMLDLSFHTPAFDENRRVTAALELVGDLFFGETSDLYRELVLERRLVESVGASFRRTRDPFLFTVDARLRNASDFDTVRSRIFAALKKASEQPVEARRLDAAKRRALASLMLSLEAPSGVGWRLSEFVSLTGDPQSLERHYANLSAVAPADLMAAARASLVPDRSIEVTLTGKEVRP